MRDAYIAVAIALFVTVAFCGYVSFQEGKAWGQAHQPVRLIPVTDYAQYGFKGTLCP